MSKMLSQLFGWKSYDHEFLIFGPSYQKRRPMLFLHGPNGSVHVISAEPRMQFQTELLGEANLLAGGSAIDTTKIREISESLIAEDGASYKSLRRLFEGIQTRVASVENAKPVQVYLGKVTTTRETLIHDSDSPGSLPPPRGYML